jgi:recombination DNA repair RAD52 pathway protein
MGFSDTTTRKLRAKLNGSNIRTREWNGRTLSYIEGWHALSEANRIFGFDGWSRETVDLKCITETGPRAQHPHCAYIAKVRISVQAGEEQIVREGTGAGYSAAGSLAEAHALAAKEAETDATKRALATFGNPFGLALYDREQKNVRRAKPTAAKPTLWEAKDCSGIVTGKYADPTTSATSLITAFEDADTQDALQSLWAHNQDLIAKLQEALTSGGSKANGTKPRNGTNGNGGHSGEIDLLAAYQARYTHLRDTHLRDADLRNTQANTARNPEPSTHESQPAETTTDSAANPPDGALQANESKNHQAVSTRACSPSPLQSASGRPNT